MLLDIPSKLLGIIWSGSANLDDVDVLGLQNIAVGPLQILYDNFMLLTGFVGLSLMSISAMKYLLRSARRMVDTDVPLTFFGGEMYGRLQMAWLKLRMLADREHRAVEQERANDEERDNEEEADVQEDGADN